MIPDLPPPTLIEDQAGLQQLLDLLAGQTLIAVDTEADSFFCYREKVCLIQVTADKQDFLIDPLCGLDLAGLGDVFSDGSKVKIFHDGEYDVLILGRCYGFRFANLFDTRIAAATLGSKSPGLGAVLEEHFGIVLDKSMQRSNWGERPLSQRQIDYGRLDTRYLLKLMERQVEQLDEAGRRMIVDGECERLEALETPPVVFNPEEWVRLKGARTLSPKARQACRELFILRDRLAQTGDVPPFRIMNNQALLNAAAQQPKNQQEISEIDGFSWKQARRLGDQMLESLEQALEKGPLNELPRLPPKDGTGGLDSFQLELHDRLKAWRRQMSDQEDFDASLIINRHVLVRLVRDKPLGLADLEGIQGLLQWQIERYGEGLLAVVKKFEEDRAAGRIETGSRRRRKG